MDVRPILAALLTLGVSPAAAAPFVAGDPQPLSARIALSRAAVTVRPAANAQAGWVIAAVLHDLTSKVKAGTTIHPRPAPPAGTALALLISNADATVEVVPVSDEAARYVASLAAPDAGADERLSFALRHLGSADSLVAEDAFASLARFTAADFEQRRTRLPREELRALVDDAATPGDRLGLYGYFLGLCGDANEDAGRLRRRLLAADGFATGADGLAAGYLMLAREQGLADLETTVLTRTESSPLLAAAVLEAFAFFRSEGAGTFPPEKLRQTACAALARPDTADLAVGYLAAGKEWVALPEVVALLNADDLDADRRRAAQVAAVRFLQECRRDADAPFSLRSAADRALSQVAASDLDLSRRATVLSGGPADRR